MHQENWTNGVVVSFATKGDLPNVNNYRGIYSHILEERIQTYTENNKTIDDCQFGFRKSKNTFDCIFILEAIINSQISRKRKLYCASIDFRNAFEYVYRNGIWFK